MSERLRALADRLEAGGTVGPLTFLYLALEVAADDDDRETLERFVSEFESL